MSKTILSSLVSILSASVLLSLSGCTESAPSSDLYSSANLPAAKEDEAAIALRIERAARALDRGEGAANAKAELLAVIADPTATAAERDDATLVLSRALEALGEKEGAIAAVEEMLAKHAGDREWAASAQAERRLRKLLTGSEEGPRAHRVVVHGPVPEFAAALVKYFPEDAKGHQVFRMLAFGGRASASEKLGTFNVQDAIGQAKQKACMNCDANLAATVDWTSWLGIPRHRASFGASFLVFYYDMEDGRIPARYESELPMPVKEIEAKLANGEGFFVAKERVGAPPVVLIAAPRAAQLDNVEEELAKKSELPLAPVSVALNGSLEAEEIQEVVRASFASFRQCYETLLQTSPSANGRVSLDFAIDTNGHVTQAKANADAPLSSMEGCMQQATQALVFPAASKLTTVVYPVMFSPG